jgi:hypothetical protein
MFVDKRRQDIYHWLSAPDYRSKHWISRTERESDTGSWFLHGNSFQQWKSEAKSFLWLHGKRTFFTSLMIAANRQTHTAGAGKTILW